MLFYWKNFPKYFILVFAVLFLAFYGCKDSVVITDYEPSPTNTKNISIKQLKLDETDTDDTELEKICEKNPELVELTLSNTKITDAGLDNLTKLKKLKKLRLSRTVITDKGMWALAKCERIEDLDLSQTEIGDFGVRELTALPRLKHLNLYLTKVTDSGLDAFKKGDHRSAAKITWLNLDKCPITDDGIPKLSSLVNLEWLHLGGTALTDAGLEELAKLKSLKEVIITKTETTPEGVERLRAALPDCMVRDNVSENTPQADIEEAAEYREKLTPIRTAGQAMGRTALSTSTPTPSKGDSDDQR